jgi:PAS domain S-box-containing protein
MRPEDKQPDDSLPDAELFHLILENVKDYAIFATDANGRVLSWNPGVERLLGYTETEIVGQPGDIIFTPEDRAAGVSEIEMQTARAHGCAEDKRWHRRKDGSRFWANGMLMPLKNKDGTLRGFAKVLRDDTAQKLAEENLEQILSSITDSFYRFDRNFRYTYVNRATTEMFGIAEKDFLGKTLGELFPDVAGNKFHREVARALKEQRTVVFENYYEPFDRWFENRAYPAGDGLSVFTSEITTRKRAEAALRESEEKYRTLFDSVDEGFCLIEVIFDDANKAFDYRFLEVNPAFEKQTGLEDAIGKAIRELAPNHEESWFEIYGRIVLTGEAARFEHRAAALNRWFDVYALRLGNAESRRVAVLFNDITTRKQAEMILREAEGRYRALIEATATTVWHANPEGALTFVGNVWTEVSGQSVEEILKWGWLDAVHPDDRERTVKIWQNALTNKTLYSTEFRILTRKGEYRWFAVNAVPILEADGSVREWVGINSDITERKQAEAFVRESEQKFAALADGVPQLVWMAEPDGFIFWYNRNWYEYTGTTPDDMKGWGWQSVHDPEMLPQVITAWQTSIETGKRFEMEFPLKGADGKFRWFLTRVNPLLDAEGRIIRWFGTNTDIDEQRRLNRRNQFVIEIDETVRPLELPEEITLTLARLLGEHLKVDRCAYAEVEADEDHFVIPGDYTRGDTHSIVGRYSMSDFGAEVLRLMRANQPYVVHDVNTDARVTEADLTAYRMTAIQAVICVPLHKNNRFSACMAVHQKTPRRWLPEEVELVTFTANRFWESIERARVVKSLHESLAREQESRLQAEQANRLKDEFLATLSHELRTPLNAILGWSQILQTRKLSTGETEKALATIERNAKSQSQLIDDILDVSRIITGKLRLNVRAVDMTGILTAAVDAVRPAAEAKNIRLRTLFDSRAMAISGDPDRLQQVVWNLLSNAVKFTPKNGRVEIRLEQFNSHIEIVVSDTGRGIEAEFLPHVFDRFRQSDGSTTRRYGGLGLGLAIVRQIVELHGGTVSVKSDGAERGATFTVNLPLLPIRRESAEYSAG